jgi:alpha-amylase/alpha-mannosidase (GH57 family)
MERYICIHCHFYQPPRENPWLEAVEVQDSAYPYHDWNERITAECYAPNSASRILDAAGRIAKITNNYARISFNFGPTLLSWMEENARRTYQAVLDADAMSRELFSGHGSALAQAYNHMILPLATRHDKETQVVWGIRDFEHRFGRLPEGMWLPETAVDLETLEVLADHGIRFTILAPHQAGQIRWRRGNAQWKDVAGGNIDPTRAYLCPLPSGRSISLFFYDGPISRAVAFERLLDSGETFANRLLSGFSDARRWPQLMHIATDGETYGHHHPHGDMALAYAFEYIESRRLATITNYGEYLEQHPPTYEARIVENTAWSCSHGLGRWSTDCGCNSGGHAGWNQQWRAPLRSALDWLRDNLAAPYEEDARQLLRDPWAARNEFVSVVLDRSPENVDAFFRAQAARSLDAGEQVRALELLEMQRHLLLMYTSCGWFFDELTGLETVQVIQYAARAVQLALRLFGDHREAQFAELLRRARSNLADFGTGAEVYERLAKPAMLNLLDVGAHYAISSVFDGFGREARVYCYAVKLEDSATLASGRARLAVGRAGIQSTITREVMEVTFGVLHFGDHNLSAAVRPYHGDEAYEALAAAVAPPFGRADLPETLRQLDRHFEGTAYSLKSLFRDEQRRIVNLILQSTLGEAEAAYRQIYDNHAPLMRLLAESRVPLPKVLVLTAEFVLNSSLRRELQEPELGLDRIHALLDEAARENVNLDAAGLEYALRRRMVALADELLRSPGDVAILREADNLVGLARSLPFEVNLWRAQNAYYEILQSDYRHFRDNPEWLRHFISLGERLGMAVPAAAPAPAEVPSAA